MNEHTDAELCHVLREAGHDCRKIPEGAMSSADDDDVAVCADDRNAAVISNDMAFGRRRRSEPTRRHVWVDCPGPRVVEVVRARLEAEDAVDWLRVLERRRDVSIRLTMSTASIRYGARDAIVARRRRKPCNEPRG